MPVRAYWAEQTVWKMKNSNMPAAEMRNRRRRPARSTQNEAPTAQHKFQMARILNRVENYTKTAEKKSHTQ